VIDADGRVGFELGEYDPGRELVIDPVLDYGTYLGGIGSDQGRAIAVDGAGDLYILGTTYSADFPANIGSLSGPSDAFVAKLSPDGAGAADLVFATYIGGAGNEFGAGGIALDAGGNIVILGSTESADLPTTAGAYDTGLGGSSDAFVAKLNPAGDTLLYATYYGGAEDSESGGGMFLDAAGDVTITGQTLSNNLPTVNAFDSGLTGQSDSYVATLTFQGGGSSDLLYSTYLGGSTDFERGNDVAVDSAGTIYVTGQTTVGHPTTAGAYQTVLEGSSDAYLTVLDPSQGGAAQLVYSTFLGGTDSDQGEALYVDEATGTVYLTGVTSSTDFDTTLGAYSQTASGGNDAFVVWIDPAGAGAGDLLYGTYLGGGGNDWAKDLAVDGAGIVYLAGYAAAGMPLVDPVQGTFGGGNSDAWVAALDPAGGGASDLGFSTYLGGADSDQAAALALDAGGEIYITGYSRDNAFPTTSGAYAESLTGPAGTADAIVAALSLAGTAVVDTTSNVVDGDTTSIDALALDPGADGRISLHEAILAANATANGAFPDRIYFDIPLDDARHFYYQDDGVAGSLSLTATTTLDDASIADFDPDYPGASFSWYSIQPTAPLSAITSSSTAPSQPAATRTG
jgi:hypothetical protein